MNPFKVYILSLIMLLLTNCSNEDLRYKVRGTVYGINYKSKKVRIAHDTIPGLMMPMEMDFDITDFSDMEKITIGDSVHFDFIWNDIKPFAENFKKVGKGIIIDKEDSFFDDEEFSEKEIGEYLDDVSLINLDNIVVSLSELENQYYFISFIFTRCPMPNMCPSVVLKNKALINSFSKLGDIDFLLISFDYIYDTPKVLKEYYGSTISNFKNLKVFSSYGRIEDIYKLAKQSGCEFWGIEEGKIGHTMQSILINKNRKILGKWPGENWEVKLVENSIKYLINN